ncbi:pyridoxal phosphate-dependent transferase [Lactarius deliciosus]|nr:pyridoxal phosphate-dependent transferase [Lactarius deliciosus]
MAFSDRDILEGRDTLLTVDGPDEDVSLESGLSTEQANTVPRLRGIGDVNRRKAESVFYKIPEFPVVARYIRSSHGIPPERPRSHGPRNSLGLIAIRTLLQSRTRAENDERHFIQFSEQEVDDLVDEWTPEPLDALLTPEGQSDLGSVPVVSGANGPRPKLANTGKHVLNLASYNFTGLAGNETIKVRAIETLRKYGVGSCGPPGFYSTIGFSTIPCVISAFAKRGDIIVADQGVNFAIQKGLQISRSTVRWFDHNDLKSLGDVLLSVEKERRKRRGPLTRRFIVTEGIFEKDGAMVDLPKLIELKHKYKYRLILDESISFGTVGRTGRGLTELYNVPATQIDMIIGSVAYTLNSSGGFCAGSRIVVDHQHINSTSFVFSAAVPALLAENVRAIRAVLDRVEGDHDPLTSRLADRPYLPAICADAFCIHIRVCEAPEPCDPWSRRARASGSLSRRRCRAENASAPLASSRPPS